MGRKAVLEVCSICGGQARKINYTTKAKGKTYHYFKYIHANGVVHYKRATDESMPENSAAPTKRGSILDLLEEIVKVKMKDKEMRFGEIKKALEDSYGGPVVSATIYRNINKLIKLNIMNKREDGSAVFYGKKAAGSIGQEIKTTSMSIGFDLTGEETPVTIFSKFTNQGFGSVTTYAITLPVGGLNSLDQIKMNAFDEIRMVKLSNENISYSWPDQTGVAIPLNKPLRKSEESELFVNYVYSNPEKKIVIKIPSDIDLLKLKCMVERGIEVQIKKRLADGLREVDPMIVNRSSSVTGYVTVETEFDNVSRGDTIVITIEEREKNR